MQESRRWLAASDDETTCLGARKLDNGDKNADAERSAAPEAVDGGGCSAHESGKEEVERGENIRQLRN